MVVGVSILSRSSIRSYSGQNSTLFSNTMFYNIQNWWGMISFGSAILVFIQIDVSLQLSDEQNKQKDIQVMKVIHDLKNPILSIKHTILDLKLHPEEVLLTTTHDCEDMEEMLENMRAEFKLKQGMELKEELKTVDAPEFAKSLASTHKALAENGRNLLKISLDPGVPCVLKLPRTLLKRMINNFITNSLKHTQSGTVEITFQPVHVRNLLKTRDWIHIGPDPDFSKKQLMVEIRDTGSGIPEANLHKIFDEKESDQTGANYDGTGLGLPICAQLCAKIGAFIHYTSVTGNDSGTVFRLFFENHAEPTAAANNKKIELAQDFRPEANQPKDTIEHKCNLLLVAEDSKPIMKRQVKQFEDNQFNQKAFSNGQELYNQVSNSGFLSCHLCTKLLIFTDLNMPFLNGRQLAVQLKELETQKDIRIVLISADEVVDSRFYATIEKPASMQKIKDIYSEQYKIQLKSLSVKSKNSKTSLSTNIAHVDNKNPNQNQQIGNDHNQINNSNNSHSHEVKNQNNNQQSQNIIEYNKISKSISNDFEFNQRRSNTPEQNLNIQETSRATNENEIPENQHFDQSRKGTIENEITENINFDKSRKETYESNITESKIIVDPQRKETYDSKMSDFKSIDHSRKVTIDNEKQIDISSKNKCCQFRNVKNGIQIEIKTKDYIINCSEIEIDI